MAIGVRRCELCMAPLSAVGFDGKMCAVGGCLHKMDEKEIDAEAKAIIPEDGRGCMKVSAKAPIFEKPPAPPKPSGMLTRRMALDAAAQLYQGLGLQTGKRIDGEVILAAKRFEHYLIHGDDPFAPIDPHLMD